VQAPPPLDLDHYPGLNTSSKDIQTSDKLVWGVRLKHFGFKGMGFARYTPDQLEAKSAEDRAPSESFTIMRSWKKNQVFFRLYDSFTNVADRRTLEAIQKQQRAAAGLDESGRTDQEQEIDQEDQEMKKPTALQRLKTLTRTAVLVVIISTVAYALGTHNTPQEEQTNAQTEIVEQQQLVWPSWNAAGTSPYFNGRPVKEGDVISPGIRLAYYAPDRRSLVAAADGDWWLWIYGEPTPKNIGSFEVVRAAVQAARDGGGQPGPTQDGEDILGASPGELLSVSD
jgi:hypothetical protein